jgi:hypothetical protein
MLYTIDHLHVWEFHEQWVGSGLFMNYPHPFLTVCVQWHTIIVELPANPWSMQVWALGCGGMNCKKNWQALGLSHYILQLYDCRHLKCFNAHIPGHLCNAKILWFCKGPSPPLQKENEVETGNLVLCLRRNFLGEYSNLMLILSDYLAVSLLIILSCFIVSVQIVIFSCLVHSQFLSSDEIGFSVEPCPGSNNRSRLLKC